jgi:hypothetical protein
MGNQQRRRGWTGKAAVVWQNALKHDWTTLLRKAVNRHAIFGTLLLAFLSISAAGQDTDVGWPRLVQSNGEQMQIYQPQVDKWGAGRLEARSAMVISERESGQAVYGVVSFSARTTLDQEKRLVTLYDIEVSSAAFPSAGTQESICVAKVTKALPQWRMTVALDRLLADLAITQTEEKANGESLNAIPPKIHVRRNPAVLILIDGKPVLRKVEGANLMRVINSPATIVLEPSSGTYFLEGDGYWMTASSLEGTWSRASNPPASVVAIGKAEAQVGGANAAQAAGSPSGVVPEIIVSTEPAELIQLKGEAQLSPIKDTQLLYVTNTDGALFMSVSQQRYYLLLSGRWCSAQRLDGPWEFVAGSALPPDFARIPPGHPKDAVLASVPGTIQAKDAVVAAQVPQTATVDRKKAQFTPTYDGEPQFKPIEGTDMMYAINSPNDIIFVAGKYYAVNDGVWFASENAQGPWVVADNVPSDIYSIPPSSPVYHVKYVYVYDSTPDFVYVGYLPGYFGAYVWDGVVVYGTGFWYPCWCGNFWFGWPWTWGFGWHYGYWGGGFFWRPWYPNRWYWHPWVHAPRAYSTWNRRVLYNRSAERIVSRPGPGSRSVYDRWQSSAVASRRPVPLKARGVPGVRPAVPTQRPARERPDLYAGKDGRVYQHRADGWYQRNGQNWEKVQPPHNQIDQLNRAQQGRIQGSNRVNQFHSIRPPSGVPGGGRPAAGGRPHR